MDNVGSFLGSGPVVDATCTAAPGCLTTELSAGGFAHATLFEFLFQAPSNGTLTVAHDDGVSLFTDAGPGNMPTGGDLFLVADSAPTSLAITEAVSLTGGQLYDLFYESGNGLPETLRTNFTPGSSAGADIDAASRLYADRFGLASPASPEETIKTPPAFQAFLYAPGPLLQVVELATVARSVLSIFPSVDT